MSLSTDIRKKLLESFRAELADHIHTITDGLLSIEQGNVASESCKATMDDVFRAAHSLKGAARAVGAVMIEQLAHALESILDAIRKEQIAPTAELFTMCYQALDTIQMVQGSYEVGDSTPPAQALITLAQLDAFRAAKNQPQAVPAGPVSPSKPQTISEITEATAKPVGVPGKASFDDNLDQLFSQTLPSPEPDVNPSQPSVPVSAGPIPLPAAMQAEERAEPGPARVAAERFRSTDETIRVSVDKLDGLMAQLSELLVLKLHAEQRLGQIKDIQDKLASWQKEWFATRNAYNRLIRQDMGAYLSPTDAFYAGVSLAKRNNGGVKNGRSQVFTEKDTRKLLNFATLNQEHLHAMNMLVNTLVREYANDTMQMELAIDKLEQEIKRVRMLPLSTITGPFRRMVRDLAQEAQKQVSLQILGLETELDKRVLEQIKDPLIHMIRNAVDHGIEAPDVRMAAGKPAQGLITLSAEHRGQDIIIQVSDDGAGLDMKAIRHSVQQQGHAPTETLSDTDLVEAIYNPGISTSPIITDISGRGMGLDIVRRNIEGLHGRITTTWEVGEGTTFTLTIPLTLTSSRGLLVRVSGELFVIPHAAIERILSVKPQDIFAFEGQDSVYFDEKPVTVVHLSDVLDLKKTGNADHGESIPLVIVAVAGRRMAFVVDETTGEQEIVIKGLGKQLARVGGITGATVLGDGRVVLILNVGDLIKIALRGKRQSILDMLAKTEENNTARAQRKILIVDDSITTRTLEKNILEAAGFAIQVATDGKEALDLIVSGTAPDLVVSDIAMPRMNGFELTQRIKSDTKTAGVPVILVTSLDSPEDKARGIDVGADAYIIKSKFDQNNLLDTIEQLI